jgi:hypothetical protein
MSKFDKKEFDLLNDEANNSLKNSIKQQTAKGRIEISDQLKINKVNGRTQIVYQKSLLKGKVTPQQLLDSVLIASRMQAEAYIAKLGRGATLDTTEVRALKELAEIAKIKVDSIDGVCLDVSPQDKVDDIKRSIYDAIATKRGLLDGDN